MEIARTGFDNIREIDGLEDFEGDAIMAMRSVCYLMRQSHKKIINISYDTMLFSGVTAEMYPGNFSKLIKRAKLGDVVSTSLRKNPNSPNKIKAYIWKVDKKALSKWFKKNRYKNEEDNYYGRDW